MAYVDEALFWQNHKDTNSENRGGLTPDQLRNYYDYFAAAVSDVQYHDMEQAAGERMVALRSEIDRRHGSAQHEQAMAMGQKTLNWARIGALAAIATAALTIPLIISDKPPSKPRPATSAQALQESSPQITATASPAGLPLEQETTSVTPTATTTPEAIATPTMTPIKFPPPAP